MPLCLAFGHAELGDEERTRELLDRAIAERSSLLALPHLIALRRLRSEPAMQRVERRLLGEGAPPRG